jgi:hypothetical protein
MNVPTGQGLPKGPKGQVVRENISLLTGKPPPREENIVSLVGMEGYEED